MSLSKVSVLLVSPSVEFEVAKQRLLGTVVFKRFNMRDICIGIPFR